MNVILKAAAISMLSVGALGANAKAIQCNACSPAAYLQRASAGGAGHHIVYDLYNRRVVGFEVFYDRELRRWDAVPEAVPAKEQEMVAALSDFYVETGGSMAKSVEVLASQLGVTGLGGANAYDVLADRNLEVRIGDRLALQGLPAGTATRLINIIIDLATEIVTANQGLSDEVVVEAIVRFEDGSRLSFKVTPGDSNAPYIQGSGRSANGEGLLEQNDFNYAASYNVTPSALGAFVSQAQRLGIPISNGSTGPGRYKCTWDGRTLDCRRI